MRLWSIHPKYLDSIGLIALWREALLAKKVLQGKTKGYKKHPQLIRFKKSKNHLQAINSFLFFAYKEAIKRGFNFDKGKIGKTSKAKISVTKKQIEFEFNWLKKKLRKRSNSKYRELLKVKKIEMNELFRIVKGKKEEWEKAI
ncbi:MAG: pyrimidine dimer DNA glycosylase/endonuclease V [Candidatus Diapherotrites archaeon]